MLMARSNRGCSIGDRSRARFCEMESAWANSACPLPVCGRGTAPRSWPCCWRDQRAVAVFAGCVVASGEGVCLAAAPAGLAQSEEHTSELQSPDHLVCRLLLEK